ncbi:hypothetical protein [Mesorhizobium sp. CAU 1732]|uniref:hypothetical protein n=1 Tax=Mesorhizobium sp. CAU 1732 TaxID=3140358 RepID=UPI003260AB2A
MSEPVEKSAFATKPESRLADAIRDMKNAVADRDDVVVDIREAQRTRLELLAEDLGPVFADIPVDDDRFDLAISTGSQPRLWIDSVAHVTMARDRRTYRFLRDTRLGRVVLAESSDLKPVAEQVTRYIAERVIERRRILEGDSIPVVIHTPTKADSPARLEAPQVPAKRGSSVLRGVAMIIMGGLFGVGAILFLAWMQTA